MESALGLLELPSSITSSPKLGTCPHVPRRAWLPNGFVVEDCPDPDQAAREPRVRALPNARRLTTGEMDRSRRLFLLPLRLLLLRVGERGKADAEGMRDPPTSEV